MRRTMMAALITALAVGCAPSPDAEPVSNNTTSGDVSKTAPELGEGLTMVSLNVEGMT